MSAAIQAAIQTQIRAVSGFDSADVSLGNYRILDQGSAPYAVIIPGPFSYAESAYGGVDKYAWTTYVDLFATFLDDSYTPLNTAREGVIARLATYPHLGIGAEDTHVSGGEVGYVYPQGGSDNPQFVRQRLVVITLIETDYSGAGEY